MSNQLSAGRPAIEAIKLAYKANQPILLEGEHGIGKSQLLEAAAIELKIKFIVRDLSLMEPPDLVGIPQINGGRTKYMPPDFLPDTGKGLLAFEELNRAESYMMAPCLQMLTARCLNGYTLPSEWLPVAAINPSSDDDVYDVKDLDPALLSRFIRIRLRASSSEWLKWAATANVHSAVTGYVRSVKDVFKSSNPRSWTYVGGLLNAYEACDTSNKAVLSASISGLVGEKHASAFMAVYSGNGAMSISVDDILTDYSRVRKLVQGWRSNKLTDKLGACVHGLKITLQSTDKCQEINQDKSMIKNLSDFISDLPGDLKKSLQNVTKEKGIKLK